MAKENRHPFLHVGGETVPEDEEKAEVLITLLFL